MDEPRTSNLPSIIRESTYWFIGWTVVALIRASQWGLSNSYQRLPVHWGLIFAETALDWYTCALLTIPYIILVRRVAAARLPNALVGGIYCLAIIAGLFVKYAIYVPLENAIFHSNLTYWAAIVNDFYAVSFGNLATLAVVVAIEHSRVAQQREIRASRLEAELSQVQLQALRSQLNPHFLFNTLNAVASLIRSDPQAAEHMLVRLSELLRIALDASGTQEVRLKSEAEFLERYGQLMRMRFGDRLSIRMDVPPELLEDRVPHFLLQPLVENSVRHGMGSGRSSITITITARADRERLRVEIADDGRGLPRESIREGIGLGHTRRRLKQLYGANASLDIGNRPGGGAAVTVTFPRRSLRES